MKCELLLLIALLAISSSPMSAQSAATYRADSAEAGLDASSHQQFRPIGFAPDARHRPSNPTHRTFVSDSADADTWRRFRIGAAIGFGVGAVAGIAFQTHVNQQATEGADISPFYDAVAFGLLGAVLGGAIAARWPR